MVDITNNSSQHYQKYIAYYLALHIPVIAAAGHFLNLPFIGPVILQLILMIVAFSALWICNKYDAISKDLTTIAIALTPGVLVYLLADTQFQVDAHMYFFAVLAMITGLRSIRATLMAAGTIAAHHLLLNFLMPAAVFPYGADFARVVFHAVIVVLETAVIVMIIRGLNQSEDLILAESEAAQAALQEANEAKKKQEEAELRAQKERTVAMSDLASDFDSQIGGLITALAEAANELHSTADNMREVAETTSEDSQTVANSSQGASTNVQTVSASMEEMSKASSEIAIQVNTVRSKSENMANNASTASNTVTNLNELTENIGEVVESIREIAEQTNLLALNATIEAARAGDAGKGFAVVADEVKKLAGETSTKTDEIEVRISDIQQATVACVEAMDQMIKQISEIDSSVSGVSAAVEEQDVTTQDIVRNVSRASNDVHLVTETIQSVQKGAQATGSSSDVVLEASERVSVLSGNLKSSVDQFLANIRTGSNG